MKNKLVSSENRNKLPNCSCCAHKQKRTSRREEYSLSLSLFFSALVRVCVRERGGFNCGQKITMDSDNLRVYFPRPKNRPAPGRFLWRSSVDLDDD